MEWSLIVSVLALVVSAALGVREFLERAIPFGYVDEMFRRTDSEWVTIAHRVHLTNLGRRPFVLDGVGILNLDGDGFHTSQGVNWILPDGTKSFRANPECPTTIQPGELLTFLVAPEHRDGQEPLGAVIVRRNAWRWLPGQPRTRRHQVKLQRARD